MLFRVVMVTTLLLVAVYVEAVSETLLRVNPLYFLIVATYALTIVHALALRFVPAARRAGLRPGASATSLVITGLVYITGGRSRAGFMLLYPISVLSGSVLLSRRRGAAPGGRWPRVFYGGHRSGPCGRAWCPPQGLRTSRSCPPSTSSTRSS